MAVKNDLKMMRKEQRLKQVDLAMAVCMCERSISNIELEKIQPALKLLCALQHILNSVWMISSIWRKNILRGSVMIIRHETVVFIPGRKYRYKATGIDQLESVERMHEGQYRMPVLLHVQKG
jgi:hypothetical protein